VNKNHAQKAEGFEQGDMVCEHLDQMPLQLGLSRINLAITGLHDKSLAKPGERSEPQRTRRTVMPKCRGSLVIPIMRAVCRETRRLWSIQPLCPTGSPLRTQTPFVPAKQV
jgi:hypothetical protein